MAKDTYVNGYDAGKRIETFVKGHCHPLCQKQALKSLWQRVRKEVPKQTKGEGFGVRYMYHESTLGQTMYNWFSEEYPGVEKRRLSALSGNTSPLMSEKKEG